jgi:hypothetical protein
MRPVDLYFINQKEPFRSIMLYVRNVILKTLPEVSEQYSYSIPFYNIGKKPMLYLNILKGKQYVDVAFVHGIVFEKEYPILKNENNRKQVRSIQLRSIEELDEHNFIELLKQAALQTKKNKRAWILDE